MAETIISPGVFTRETDESFLAAGIAQIGAAIIGPTVKGPAMTPVSIGSMSEFITRFGPTTPNLYTPYAAENYFSGEDGQLTVIRVLHDDGYQAKNMISLVATGSFGSRHIASLHPSQVIADTGLTFDIASATDMFERTTLSLNSSGSAILKISGSYGIDSDFSTIPAGTTGTSYSASIIASNANYLGKVFSKVPTTTTDPAFLYTLFGTAASASIAADPSCTLRVVSASFISPSTYSEATTPWIISQTVNGTNYNLFKFHTLSHGDNSNYEIKVGISDIKAAGTVAGSEYGSFTVTIRAVDQTYLRSIGSPYDRTDSDNRPTILETFDNVNLDPNSTRYIARVIGDKYKTFANGKVTSNGDYPNKSNYVRVEVDSNVDSGVNSELLVPFGFAALFNPLPAAFGNIPTASFITEQTINGSYNKRRFFGFDFEFGTTDNINYLKPLPATATTGSNIPFVLSNYNQHNSFAYSGSIDLVNSSVDSRKFIVPFQGGFDGTNPNKRALTGDNIIASNTQGYDLSSVSAKDYSVYKNAIDILSNPNEIDINQLALPGVIQSLHPAIIDYAANMCLDRGDVFFPYDCVGKDASIADAVSTVQTTDNNYSATWYPWVKIVDKNLNKPVWVPPGVVLPGVLAFNDKVAAEWYAPAGMTRGGLTSVTETATRLTTPERDVLYQGRVNPIANFPDGSIVVWGQKTLQAKPSALDRINVRRMLIAVKKFVASSTRYLVFENNTAVTRSKFINLTTPYLESIQQRQGIYSFSIQMDAQNNTADVIDRNIMYGKIALKPTKTAEIIIIDFNIQPTGAAFSQ